MGVDPLRRDADMASPVSLVALALVSRSSGARYLIHSGASIA